jgi:hypothetical protein
MRHYLVGGHWSQAQAFRRIALGSSALEMRPGFFAHAGVVLHVDGVLLRSMAGPANSDARQTGRARCQSSRGRPTKVHARMRPGLKRRAPARCPRDQAGQQCASDGVGRRHRSCAAVRDVQGLYFISMTARTTALPASSSLLAKSCSAR